MGELRLDNQLGYFGYKHLKKMENTSEKIWIEKFRPSTFEEIKGQDKIVERIKAMVKNKNIPHLLLTGPSGVGKSTTALVLAKELFGENWRQNFYETNASDSRGIDTVRNEIKEVCRIKSLGSDLPKIIFLDECDALTKEAQSALRRMMEQYTNSARFVLSCVTPDTKVMLKDEVEINIESVKLIKEAKMLCADTKSMSVESDTSMGYMESSTKINNKKIIKIKTDTERCLSLTEDHLVFTKNGWKCAGDLTKEDYVAILPVLEDTPLPNEVLVLNEEDIEEQVHFFEKRILGRKELYDAKYYWNLPSKSMKKLKEKVSKLYYNQNLTKSEISREIKEKYNLDLSVTQTTRLIKNRTKTSFEKVYHDLKQKGLIPLTTSNKKISILCRLIGYLFGDGYLPEDRKRVTFVGDYSALQKIRKEVIELGFKVTEINSIKKEVVIKGKKTKGTSSVFYSYSKSFWILLSALGVPQGNKCKNKYSIPKWILKGPKLIKREFLRGFFDAEMSTPILEKKTPTRFGQLDLTQHKIKDCEESCFEFLKQCQDLLKEFEIVSYIKIKTMPYRRKDGNYVTRFQLKISSNTDSLFNFFRRIGFYYESKKIRLGRLAHEYLRYKKCVLNSLKESSKNAVKTFSEKRESKISVANRFGISVSLLTNQLENKQINLPYTTFPNFYEWVGERSITKNSEFVWNKIESIEDYSGDIVYDLFLDKFHNFIGNGFLLHNCNYSSKIIDPIQSRCTIFRFKPLEKKDIEKIIENVAKIEGLKIDKDAIDALYEISEGDVRRVENVLQSCSVMSKKITQDLIYDIVSAAKPKEIKQVLELCISKNFTRARDLLLEVMLKHGLSGIDIIKQIQKEILSLDIKDEKKLEMVEKCGEIEFRLVEGSDEFIQLESLLAGFSK